MADRIKDAKGGDLVARRKGLQAKADDPKTDAKTARNARREIGNINKSLRDRSQNKGKT
jgi:hypothetical protein